MWYGTIAPHTLEFGGIMVPPHEVNDLLEFLPGIGEVDITNKNSLGRGRGCLIWMSKEFF